MSEFQVYVPMSRDDVESLSPPAGDDVTPAAATGTQRVDSLPSHDVIDPTLPAHAFAIHGYILSTFERQPLTLVINTADFGDNDFGITANHQVSVRLCLSVEKQYLL